MLTHPTIDQLRALKLDGMADAFTELQAQDRAKDLDHAEWLALLLDREAANRNTKRFQSRLRSAKLRHGQASVEDVDYRTARRLDKALFQQLATGRWIAEHRNLLVTGPCGVGKSWLSCALAQKACRDGYTVHYAAPVCRSGAGSRRWPLRQAVPHAGEGRSADPRRLGPRSPHRQPAARPDGDRRGPLWPGLDAHHQSAADRHVARRHRRADLRRRHPRSHRAQRLSARARRAIDTQGPGGRGGCCGAAGRRHDKQHKRDAIEASEGSQEMTVALRITPAPVGQQAPPTRAAASDSWRSLRVARGSLLLTTGTGSTVLDVRAEH